MSSEIGIGRKTTLQNGYLNLIRFLGDKGKFWIQGFNPDLIRDETYSILKSIQSELYRK